MRENILAATESVEKSAKVQLWDKRHKSNADLSALFSVHLGHVAPRIRPAVVRECVREINAVVMRTVEEGIDVFLSVSKYEIEESRVARKAGNYDAGFTFGGEWSRKMYRKNHEPQSLQWAKQIRNRAPFLWNCTCRIAKQIVNGCDSLFKLEEATRTGRAARLKRYRSENTEKWVEEKLERARSMM